MKYTLLILMFMSTVSAFGLTRTEAIQLSKTRIEGLKTGYAELAYSCFLFEEDCQIRTNSQSGTLKWLQSELSDHPAQIQYSSGPENFTIDGAVRIAKTGSTWGSPVIFNEDLLCVPTGNGQYEALEFFEILGILIHEFGHHQEQPLRDFGMPTLNHEELDELAVKTVSYLKDRTKRIHIGPDEVENLSEENSINIYYIELEWNNGVRNLWSNIYVDNRSETKEVSNILYQNLGCPRILVEGRVTFEGYAAYAAFRQMQVPQIIWNGTVLSFVQQVDDASVLCIDEQSQRFNIFGGYKNGKLRLNFATNPSGQLGLQSGSFWAITPPDWNMQRGNP
jgi:hypothetical protein